MHTREEQACSGRRGRCAGTPPPAAATRLRSAQLRCPCPAGVWLHVWLDTSSMAATHQQEQSSPQARALPELRRAGGASARTAAAAAPGGLNARGVGGAAAAAALGGAQPVVEGHGHQACEAQQDALH